MVLTGVLRKALFSLVLVLLSTALLCLRSTVMLRLTATPYIGVGTLVK
jgi:hypothetical protein